MKLSENILNLIENMTLIELNNLIDTLEKKYNLENILNFNKNEDNFEKKEQVKKFYSLHLIEPGKSKVSVIKIIKDFNNLGLKEAKDLVESSPILIKNNLEFDVVQILKEKLEKVGAKIDIKND